MNCALHGTHFPKPKEISVNGTVIDRAATTREVQHHPASRPFDAWQAAARALVVRELLLQEARRLAIAAQPLVDDVGRREIEEEALIRTLYEREVTTPEPDLDTCRRYYECNRNAFRSATRAQCRASQLRPAMASTSYDSTARSKAGSYRSSRSRSR